MEEQEKMLGQPEAKLELPAGKRHIPTSVGIAIIVLVAVFLFGGVFAYQYFFVKPQVVVQPVDQLVGWKTYTNTQYGIEFNYPKNYFIVSEGLQPKRSDNKFQHKIYNISFGWDGQLEMSPYFGVDVYDSISNNSWVADMEYSQGLGGFDSSGKYIGNTVVSKNPDVYKFNFSFGDYGGGSSFYGIVGDKYSIYFGPFFGDDTTTGDISKSILSTFKFTTPASQTTLQLWPDVNSFDLVNKTFQAKGIGKDTQTTKSIKVYTNSSAMFSSKDMQTAMNNFQDMYAMMKNWVGPEWWFNVKGILQSDGSLMASEISIAGQ
jgi:hypothetical protein